MDYDSGPYNVTIPAGETSGTLNITINDDVISEANETFMLTISSSSDVNCDDNCQATVTILDNDGKYTQGAKKERPIRSSNYLTIAT